MKPRSSQIQPPGLYVVATPIGNLGDITLRALELLKSCDMVVCEDTRVSGKLFSHYGIGAPLLSYNDHNAAARRPQIMRALQEGKKVALISDAGMPLVSDPGYKLVSEALKAGLHVTTLPGASSVLSALVLSGLPSDRFFFAGFLPARQEARRKELAALAAIPSTLIFFESAQRLSAALAAMQQELGDREAAVVREITKLFEESRRGTLAELAAHYAAHETKGEVVIVVGQPEEKAVSTDDMEHALALLLKSHSVKEAAAIMAAQTGRSRKELYTLALGISSPNRGEAGRGAPLPDKSKFAQDSPHPNPPPSGEGK